MVAFRFHQYQVVGRALPSEGDEHPKIYRMKLWATNEVRAKSKFWYFLRKLKKVKKSNGQVLAINEIFERNPTKIKNYGIWLRYQSRTGYHNMYKEYRDTTLNGAVEQMYNEMASRHRVRFHCIQIIKTATVPAKLCKRESTKQFHDSKIKFPLCLGRLGHLRGSLKPHTRLQGPTCSCDLLTLNLIALLDEVENSVFYQPHHLFASSYSISLSDLFPSSHFQLNLRSLIRFVASE
uniref:Large ribosomal subunit protein eL20 domain-containing protein n=1 Tax=Ananas comosus var. bracteatus TaxID=296719 RepID=A0A6V7PU64_ANACO|nr:unnamed protein product [Ananas comosus var. bracteatus]